MKKRIAVLFAVLIIAVASVFGAACNYPNKNNMYKRWGINIPAGAKEVYKSYEGGREYLLYAVYQADKDDIKFDMQPVDEEYETKFEKRFKSVYSKRVSEDRRINWEHDLDGYYDEKSDGLKTVFCVFDKEENLLYVMDTTI